MAGYVVEAEMEWKKTVRQLEDQLKQLDVQLQDNMERRAEERNRMLKELLDPTLMKERHDELKQLELSLKKLAEKGKSIQLDVQMPIIPGVHLLVTQQNQRAMTNFVPCAYDALVKTPGVVDGLKTISNDISMVTDEMNKSVLAMTQATREMTSRIQRVQKQREDFDAALRMQFCSDNGEQSM